MIKLGQHVLLELVPVLRLDFVGHTSLNVRVCLEEPGQLFCYSLREYVSGGHRESLGGGEEDPDRTRLRFLGRILAVIAPSADTFECAGTL
jgi:hypothetical protein